MWIEYSWVWRFPWLTNSIPSQKCHEWPEQSGEHPGYWAWAEWAHHELISFPLKLQVFPDPLAHTRHGTSTIENDGSHPSFFLDQVQNCQDAFHLEMLVSGKIFQQFQIENQSERVVFLVPQKKMALQLTWLFLTPPACLLVQNFLNPGLQVVSHLSWECVWLSYLTVPPPHPHP